MQYFEWDENKRDFNLQKHGLDFVDAVKIFNDPCRIELESERNNEIRYKTIGIIDFKLVILLVYANRGKKKRIISARRASKKERAVYYGMG